MGSVYKKELKTYKNGMIGAIVIAFLLLMAGVYLRAYNFYGASPFFEYVLGRGYFFNVAFLYTLVIPVLTMRSIAEEKHSRTDQLLYSLPMRMSQIVAAKYFAMLTVLAVPCVIFCFYPLILASYGTVHLGGAYATILAFFLLGAALCAIGMFVSSLTESQVIAAVVSLGLMLLLYFSPLLTALIPDTAGVSLVGFFLLALIVAALVLLMTKSATAAVSVGVVLVAGLSLVYIFKSSLFEGAIPRMLSALAPFDRLTVFASGLFDLTGIVFYVSTAALFVFLTVQSMEKKRWN